MANQQPAIPQVDTTYAWRLLAKELRPGVAPTVPICNRSFSPLALHVSASILAAGSSVTPAEPSPASAALQTRLLSFLSSNGFAPGLPSNAAYDAIAAAVALNRVDDADDVFAYFSSALWARRYLRGHNDLLWETGRYRTPIRFHDDFQSKAAEARDDVNSWLRTTYLRAHPEELIPPGSVHDDTQFIVGNVLAFFGTWAWDLRLEPGTYSEFYKLDGFSFLVPFMTSKKPQQIACYSGFKALRLPYKYGKNTKRFAMYIFLPDARDGLFDLLHRFANEPQFFERHLPEEMVPVGEFKVPIRHGSVACKSVGTVWPPSPYASWAVGEEEEERADPTNVPFQPSCFSTILFLEFNDEEEKDEDGKGDGEGKGKAIGDVVDGVTGCYGDGAPVDFVADHAFLYAIREDTRNCADDWLCEQSCVRRSLVPRVLPSCAHNW